MNPRLLRCERFQRALLTCTAAPRRCCDLQKHSPALPAGDHRFSSSRGLFADWHPHALRCEADSREAPCSIIARTTPAIAPGPRAVPGSVTGIFELSVDLLRCAREPARTSDPRNPERLSRRPVWQRLTPNSLNPRTRHATNGEVTAPRPRGLTAFRAEWQLATAVHNILRLRIITATA